MFVFSLFDGSRWWGQCAVYSCVPRTRSQQYQSAHSAGSFGITLLQCGHFQYSWIMNLLLMERVFKDAATYGQFCRFAFQRIYVYMAVQIHAKLIVIMCALFGFVSLHTHLQHSCPFIHGWGFVALLVLYIKYCTCPGLWKKRGFYRLILT